MRRLGILMAALVAFAVAMAPVYASAATPCPCQSAPASDCPCDAGGCDLMTPPGSSCHCAPMAALLASSFVEVGAAVARDQWLVPSEQRLRSMKAAPLLRPPILL
jgi:hypothetical protein